MSVDPSHGKIRVSLEKQSTHCCQTVQLTFRDSINDQLVFVLDMRNRKGENVKNKSKISLEKHSTHCICRLQTVAASNRRLD